MFFLICVVLPIALIGLLFVLPGKYVLKEHEKAGNPVDSTGKVFIYLFAPGLFLMMFIPTIKERFKKKPIATVAILVVAVIVIVVGLNASFNFGGSGSWSDGMSEEEKEYYKNNGDTITEMKDWVDSNE